MNVRPLTLHRIKIAAGILAATVTIGGGIYAAGTAHGDQAHEIDGIKARLDRLEALPDRIGVLNDRLVRVEAGVDAIRTYFAIPKPGGRP